MDFDDTEGWAEKCDKAALGSFEGNIGYGRCQHLPPQYAELACFSPSVARNLAWMQLCTTLSLPSTVTLG